MSERVRYVIDPLVGMRTGSKFLGQCPNCEHVPIVVTVSYLHPDKMGFTCPSCNVETEMNNLYRIAGRDLYRGPRVR